MFEEIIWDVVVGVEFFLIIDGQWEEVLVFVCVFGGDGGDQQYGVVYFDDDCIVGLVGDFVGFKCDGVFVVLEGFGDFCYGGCFWGCCL